MWPMKTIVDISKINDLNCGLGQFANYLQEELVQLDPEITFYAEDKVKDRIIGKHFLAKKKWHRNKYLFRPRADVWHGIHQDVDVFPAKNSLKKVLTFHDINFIYENSDERKKQKWLKRMQQKINSSHAITFISEFTRKEVERYFNLTDKKCEVIYNGICIKGPCEAPSEKIVELVNKLDSNYFFSIGTVVPKKNYKILLEMAKTKEDFKIIVAGTTFHHYAKEMMNEIIELGFEDRIHLIGEISEADKYYLYQNSSAFFHPSRLEGFGLPVIEAMFLGKPVLCSNTTSLPEVTGGLAYMFNPESAMEANVAMSLFQEDKALGKIDSVRLKAHAEQFSWKRAARQYYELYSSL